MRLPTYVTIVVIGLISSLASILAINILPPVVPPGLSEDYLLVLSGDVGVPEGSYVTLGQAIQKSSSFRLWVAISIYSATTQELKSVVNSAVQFIFEKNSTTIVASATFVAGHGQAGFVAADLVEEENYGGLLLLGSYLIDKIGRRDRLEEYKQPVLTLGGELNGFARITRIALEFQTYLQIKESEGAEFAVPNKAVIAIPGINHAQISGGVVGPENLLDLVPDLSDADATVVISRTISDFLAVNKANDIVSFKRLEQLIEGTEELVQGFLSFLVSEKCTYCFIAQTDMLNLSPENLPLVQTTCNYHNNIVEFSGNPTSLAVVDGVAQLGIHNWNPEADNPDDKKPVQISPTQMNCKLKSQESITNVLNITESNPDGNCKAINLKFFDLAIKSLQSTSYSRYLQKGTQLNFVDDIVKLIGPGWLVAKLKFEPSASQPNTYDVAAVSLYTALDAPGKDYWKGNDYCILFPPSFAVEWILVDSLPKLKDSSL